jgi:manganese transport protein
LWLTQPISSGLDCPRYVQPAALVSLRPVLHAAWPLLVPCSFVYEMAVAQPNWLDVGKGFVPTGQLFTNPDMLYIAIGILGATVMPHNLYLHSAVIQTRAWTRCPQGRRAAIKYGTLDSSLSLLFAFLINASILILAGAAFYYGGDPHRCGNRLPQAPSM